MSTFWHSCSFTGHRAIPASDLPRLRARLDRTVRRLALRGVREFYAGGALGFDTLAELAVLRCKREFPRLKLTLLLPCKGQEIFWREADRFLYHELLWRADKVEYAAQEYQLGCMQRRNRLLAERADVCVCYCWH
jgi:uncharacterized phage-like protein YoqJ